MPKEKIYVPIVEPKSTSYLEIIELGRTVTPHPVFKKDTVFVRVLKINKGRLLIVKKCKTKGIEWSKSYHTRS